MSDTNRKSIMDFVARSQKQFAERRKQQQEGAGDSEDLKGVSAFVVPRSVETSTNGSTGTAASSAPPQQKSNEERAAMIKSWASKVEDFVNDATLTRMELPNLLSGADRRDLHALATQYNLSHSSVGSGTQRRLVITKDSLFYRGNNAGITTAGGVGGLPTSSSAAGMIDAGAVSAAVAGTGQRTMSRKERHEMRNQQNEKELYADTAAIKGFRRFQDAINPLAKAVAADDGADFEVPRGFNPEQPDNSSSFVASAAAGIREPRRRQRDGESGGGGGGAGGGEEKQKQPTAEVNYDQDDQEAGAAPIAQGELMTADQVAEAATVNELSEADVSWIKQLAQRWCTADDRDGSKGGTERIVFCIDFCDFLSACGPLARAKNQNKKVAVIDVTDGEQDEEEFGNKMLAIIEAAGGASCCMCLPGMPLFGEPLRVGIAFVTDSISDAVDAACRKAGATVSLN